jgi:MOSC domain-containing protein YiiM
VKGRIVQINISPGGVPKTPVATARGGHYARVSQKRVPGWSRVYARVVTPGTIRQGDPVHLLTEAEAAEVLAPARP